MKTLKNKTKILFAGLTLVGLTLTSHPKAGAQTDVALPPGSKLYEPTHPDKYNPSLFVVLHGCATHVADIEAETHFDDIAEQFGFYVYYPELNDPSNTYNCWPYITPALQRADSPEMKDFMLPIRELKLKLGITNKNTFIAGMSAGASFSSNIISCFPEEFGGALLHSGVTYGLTANSAEEGLWILRIGPIPLRPRNHSCNPANYKGKLLIYQGSLDELVSPIHPDLIAQDFMGESTNHSQLVIPNVQGQRSFKRTDYVDPSGKLRGQQFIIYGMRHAWSGGDAKSSYTDPAGPNASRHAVDMFLGASPGGSQ